MIISQRSQFLFLYCGVVLNGENSELLKEKATKNYYKLLFILADTAPRKESFSMSISSVILTWNINIVKYIFNA